MLDSDHTNALINLLENFLFLAGELLNRGIIDQNVYDNITENKINFLKAYKAE